MLPGARGVRASEARRGHLLLAVVVVVARRSGERDLADVASRRRALEPRPFLISWVRPGARGARTSCDQLFVLRQGRGERDLADVEPSSLSRLGFVGAPGCPRGEGELQLL